jgi:hypothetical protein
MKKIKIGDCAKDDDHMIVAESEAQKIIMNADGDTIIGLKVWESTGDYIQWEASLFENASIPTLHLPIGNDAKKYGGAWFDLILGGVKKEEYREVSAFYEARLVWFWDKSKPKSSIHSPIHGFEVLHLTNGYNPKNQQLWVHIESITIGRGNPEWGAPIDRDVFIIKLGAVFHTKNLKP